MSDTPETDVFLNTNTQQEGIGIHFSSRDDLLVALCRKAFGAFPIYDATLAAVKQTENAQAMASADDKTPNHDKNV